MPENVTALAAQIEADLLELYGSPILGGEDLQRALGFKTRDALRQAICRKTLKVPVFVIENRRGPRSQQ